MRSIRSTSGGGSGGTGDIAPATGSAVNQNSNQSIGIGNQQQVVPTPIIPGN